jgi:hypothetical protein
MISAAQATPCLGYMRKKSIREYAEVGAWDTPDRDYRWKATGEFGCDVGSCFARKWRRHREATGLGGTALASRSDLPTKASDQARQADQANHAMSHYEARARPPHH